MTLTPDELEHLQQHGQVTVIRPLVEQVIEDINIEMSNDTLYYRTKLNLGYGGKNPLFGCIPLQFPVGKQIAVKGTDIRPTVVSNEVKRLSDITRNEIHIMGFARFGDMEDIPYYRFADWFNERFAKPKWNRKKKCYECYAWDWDSWAKWCYNNHLKDYTKGDWKGKPLTIYPNAWFELARLEEK